MRLSIILPALEEAAGIVGQLTTLQPLRERGHEVIVVDGGSADRTVELALPFADRVLITARGRALQMNVGAAEAAGDAFLFLHADTRLPDRADLAVAHALDADHAWGRFDVRIEGRHPVLRVIASMMNVRSRWTGIATGDQALFMTRAAFAQAGGFPRIPLMEDIALSKALKRISRPACLPACVVTSGRRWEQHGVWRTMARMWRLRLAYFLGVEPARLARHYTPHGS